MALLVFLSSVNTLIQLFRESTLQPFGYHTVFVLTALQSDDVASFVPILAVLPYSGSFVDDVKSKFARFSLIRTSYCTYLIIRVMTCFLLGGGVIVTGTILSWIVSTLLFLPIEETVGTESDSVIALLTTCGLLFINGGFWAVVGITMSTLMESKYIAYASPFVIFYLLVILCERYFLNEYIMYPLNWLKPDIWPYGALGVTVLLLELTLAFGVLFLICGGRRLQKL